MLAIWEFFNGKKRKIAAYLAAAAGVLTGLGHIWDIDIWWWSKLVETLYWASSAIAGVSIAQSGGGAIKKRVNSSIMLVLALVFSGSMLATPASAHDPLNLRLFTRDTSVADADLVYIHRDGKRYPSSIRTDRMRKAEDARQRDSVLATQVRASRAYLDTINGYKQTVVAVLDSLLTGAATTPSDSVKYVCGATVTFCMKSGISVTGTGTAATFGHAPADCRPTRTVVTTAGRLIDADSTTAGYLSVATTGVMTFIRTTPGGGHTTATLTAGGARGIPAGQCFTYSRF